MRWSIFCFSIAIVVYHLSAVPTFAQYDEPQTVDWKQDLEFIAKTLPEKHVDFFHDQPKEKFDERVDRLMKKLDAPSHTDGTLLLMELVASAGDSHTGIRPDPNRFHYFPFNARWFDDGLFITHADHSLSKILGAKIVSINDHPIKQILQSLEPLFATDNEYGFRQIIDKQLNTAEYLQYAGAIADVRSANFGLEKEGERFDVEVKSYSRADAQSKIKWAQHSSKVPLYRQKPTLSHWNDWFAKDNTLYFNYRKCNNDRGFRLLVNGTKGFMAQNEVAKFVLDLRQNTGGDSSIFKPLFEFLSTHEELNQKGRLFVVVGRNTFSSGLWAANDMKKTNAIFVGEPTAGKLNHFGEIKFVELPSSKMQLFYSTRRWTLSKTDDSNTFAPDHHVQFFSKDFFEGKDAALEWILKHK